MISVPGIVMPLKFRCNIWSFPVHMYVCMAIVSCLQMRLYRNIVRDRNGGDSLDRCARMFVGSNSNNDTRERHVFVIFAWSLCPLFVSTQLLLLDPDGQRLSESLAKTRFWGTPTSPSRLDHVRIYHRFLSLTPDMTAQSLKICTCVGFLFAGCCGTRSKKLRGSRR